MGFVSKLSYLNILDKAAIVGCSWTTIKGGGIKETLNQDEMISYNDEY